MEVKSVESRRFSEVLRAAVAGDPDAMEAIIAKYMPLVNRKSITDGKLDEDMRQYILMRIVMQIPRFDPDRMK
jgi:DNA-directed RNA polymerase specialized sigma subunit